MDIASKNEGSRYEVKELQPGQEASWDAFVEGCNSGTFFHLTGWKKILENALRHPTTYLYCEREGKIVGVLPLAQIKSVLFGNAVMSLPFTVYGGVATADPRAESLLIDAAVRKSEAVNADYLELRNRTASGRDWPTRVTHATFAKSIDPDPEKNLLAIPRKQRAMVRKGIKAGLEAHEEDDTEQLYQALLSCKRNLGTPFFNKRYLQYVRDTFGDRAEILTVTHSGRLICSVMSFRFRNEILPYYGGGGDIARTVYGNDFMYWSVMKRASEAGVTVFDYGRSAIGSGAYKFKKNWGFEPEPLPYEVRLLNAAKIPEISPSSPKYRYFVEAWKRLPLSVASVVGPFLARRLG